MKQQRASTQRQHSGFSLVELMISLVIGLLLLAGILQILLGNREGFQAQRSSAELQQNARFASHLFNTTLAHAGYRQDAFQDESDVMLGAGVTGTEGNPDSVTIRFQSDGNMHDCIGAQIDAGQQSRSTFRLSDADPESGLRELQCFRQRLLADGTVDAQQVQSLIGDTGPDLPARHYGVEDMQIRYGEDTNNDGSADAYFPADEVTDFDRVKSIEIALVLASQMGVRPEPGAQTLTVFSQSRTFGDSTDTRAREVVEQVIALRNRLR